MSSLEAFCDTVAEVAVSEAKKCCDQFVKLAGEGAPDPTQVFTILAFMNWAFAAGVWSNISHTRLRRDLLRGLKDALIMRMARNLAEGAPDQAAKCVFLADEFNNYISKYEHKTQMLTLREPDSGIAAQFAFQCIQAKNQLDDSIMNRVLPKLIPDKGLAAAVESVAAEVNIAMMERKDKGFFGRFFGR